MSKFKKGRSGNPIGRPKGIEDKRASLRSFLEPHAPQLIAKVVAKALEGDATALRICLDRLIPPMRACGTPIVLGRLEGTLVDQARAVLAAMTDGRITPDEGAALIQGVAAQAKIHEVDELERRVAALEEAKHAST